MTVHGMRQPRQPKARRSCRSAGHRRPFAEHPEDRRRLFMGIRRGLFMRIRRVLFIWSMRSLFMGIRRGILFLWILLLPWTGQAAGTWITVGEDTAPPDYLVRDVPDSEMVTVTFLGDCTLGGETKSERASLGFNRRIEENGMEFPFRGLISLTRADDLTVANLEGVLTDRDPPKEKKKYNFKGPASYARILSLGGIEAVTLANNHSHDYGEPGYEDTKTALETGGIGWFGTDAPAVWQSGSGVMIGFLGVNYSLTGNRFLRYREQAELLREMGCACIITVMHAGTEYSYSPPDAHQKQIVERAAEVGSCLVIGHHPHVVQGWAQISEMPVVYSLGNCSFGGTTHAKDSDACAVQAVLIFSEGELTSIRLRFFPISITSDDRYNNYSPRLLTGAEGESVLRKMEKSTGNLFETRREDGSAEIFFDLTDEK